MPQENSAAATTTPQPVGDLIAVEVAYATPQKQHLLAVNVPANSSVEDAIKRSGILEQCPEVDLSQQKVGVWGKICSLEQILVAQDRAEIYRSLKADPKEARRKRAKQDKA